MSVDADPLGAAAVNDDPLGAVAVNESDDPLSGGGAAGGSAAGGGAAAGSGPTVVPLLAGGAAVSSTLADGTSARVAGWKEKRALIIKQYAAVGQLKVNSALLDADGVAAASLGSNIDEAGPSGAKKVALDSKTQRRLEQLDKQEEDGKTIRLTQAELVARVDKLNAQLKQAWREEERVRALKIAIQVSKMLGDTSYPTFFPTVFAVVAEILDAFGELVYERVLAKGTPHGKVLPPGFTHSEVAEEGVETTRNWFYKVASIRELVPRFYVEIAILKCYRLLMPSEELPKIVERLARAIRGFGDPLAATYARSYLVHKAIELTPLQAPELVHGPVMDTFFVFERQLQLEADGSGVLKGLHHVKAAITPAAYFGTFQPALEWLLQSLAEFHPTQEMFISLVKAYRSRCKMALLLNAIIGAFEPSVVAKNALPLCELIRETDASGFSRHHLYVSLGRVLCAHPPKRDELLQVLNDVWAELGTSKSAHDYVSVACQYLQLLLSQFGVPEVHKLLKDLLKRVSADKAYLNLMPQLQSVVGTVLHAGVDHGAERLSAIFVLEPFQRMLALFDRPTALENWKSILIAFEALPISATFVDPTLVHNLTHVARQLHDSLDHLSFDDERRQLGSLISGFVRRVSFGGDFEAHLSFYVECRGIFCNLDAVQDVLVLGAAALAMRVRERVKGRHTKKTAAFAKACAAYMYITTPTIDSSLLRIRLHLLGAQVALANGLLAQSEACFKAAVTVVPEALSAGVGKDGVEREPEGNAALREVHAREEALVSLLSAGCSYLVSVPGHPKHGPFFLATGFLNVIQSAKWRLPASRLVLYARMLALFSTYAQRALPYHVPGVDANDVLYAAEPEYAQKLTEVCGLVLLQVDAEIASLAESAASAEGERAASAAARKALHASAVRLFELVLASAELLPPMAGLANKLFALAAKMSETQAERAHLARVAAHLKALGGKGGAYTALHATVQGALMEAAATKR